MIMLLQVLLLTGCGPETPGGADSVAASPGISDVVVEPGEVVPSVLRVRWSTELPSSSTVQLKLDDELAVTVEDTALSTSHDLRVQGLKAGRDYELSVSSSTGDTAEESEWTTVSVEPPPDWVPAFTVSLVDDTRHEGGWVLMNVGNDVSSGAVIVDRDGDVVWWAGAGEDVLSTASTLSRDGQSVLLASQQKPMEGDDGDILEVALDGSTSTSHPAPGLHHAFVELEDGSLAYLAVDIQDYEGDQVIADTIRVVNGDGEVSELFNAWDHFVPEALCSHYAAVAYAADAIDWLHANSLALDSERGSLHMMARNWDALLEVDLATGALVGQIGGAQSELAYADPDYDAFDHPHFSQLTTDGIVLMDNGTHRSPEASRAVEYSFDRDAGIIELVWEYWDPEGRYVSAIGDVEKLAGGNHLVSWTTSGLVTEIADQDVVWQLEAALGSATGWVAHLPSLQGRVR
jgi:Arylsulfotransferase (ASST)